MKNIISHNKLRNVGYISTIRKNGINVIEGIVSAFHNFPWSPNRTKDISGESLLSQNLALA
jgi:hypothetical protein